MGVEKELFYQVLDRQIDNIIGSVAPQFGTFSGIVKSKIHGFIAPYVEAFTDDGTVDVETSSAFLKEKALTEIENFKKKCQDASH